MRAMGEFGAVSVVSGHIRGHTNTMPLHVGDPTTNTIFVAAFAVASLLALLALVTLVAKEHSSKVRRDLKIMREKFGKDRVSIEVRKISKDFGAFLALKDVELKVRNGEFVALLGPLDAARPRSCVSSRDWTGRILEA